jgi:hypothetical protein
MNMFKYFAVFKSGRLSEYQLGNDFPSCEPYAADDEGARDWAEDWIEEYNKEHNTNYKLYIMYPLGGA